MKKLFLYFSFVGVIAFYALEAQNVEIPVNNDFIINQILTEAQDKQLSSEQVRQLAQDAGLGEAEIQQLLTQIPSEGQVPINQSGTPTGLNNARGQNQRNLGDPNAPESEIFGLDFFRNAQANFSPNPNIATPTDYILGTGDELSVEIYGTSQAQYQLRINRDGKASIPRIGPINLAGLSIQAAESQLKRSLGGIYSGIRGSNPSVFVEVGLTSFRTITVNLVGEVSAPGNYALPAFSNVLNALYSAGGPTELASLRNIKVYRDGDLLGEVDLYDFLISGSSESNFNLKSGDFIVVQVFNKRVEVSGEVKRPGIFELRGDESVEEIISWAGDFTAQAFTKNVTLLRDKGADQLAKDLLISESFNFQDGDELVVKETDDFESNFVQIKGAVQVEGVFEWQENITLGQLLKSAGGLTPNADATSLTVFRRNEKLLSTVELGSKSTGLDSSFTLNRGDLVLVPDVYSTQGINFVQVSGEVYDPSTVPFYEQMTVSDVITLSGGLLNAALGGKIEVIRRNQDDRSSYEIIKLDIPKNLEEVPGALQETLQPFDHIYVRTAPGFQDEVRVMLEGEVQHPGIYTIASPNMLVSELIERAGGMTKNAYVQAASLYRLRDGSQEQEAVSKQREQIEQLMLFLERKSLEGSLHPQQVEYLENRLSQLRADEMLARQKIARELSEDLVQTIDTSLVSESYSKNLAITYPSNISLTIGAEEEDAAPQESFGEYIRVGISLDEIILDPGGKADIILLPGDRLVVPRKPETVIVSGEVLFPNSTRYIEGKRLKTYVNQAGGFSLVAKRKRSYVIYPSGDAARTKQFLFFTFWPKIEPGSEIVVPDGRLRQGLAGVQQVFGILTGAASVITSYLLIRNLSNQ